MVKENLVKKQVSEVSEVIETLDIIQKNKDVLKSFGIEIKIYKDGKKLKP